MDLGATLGYSMSPDANEQLLSISFHPGVLMKSITREELVEWYAEAGGPSGYEFLDKTSNIWYLPLRLATGIVTH